MSQHRAVRWSLLGFLIAVVVIGVGSFGSLSWAFRSPEENAISSKQAAQFRPRSTQQGSIAPRFIPRRTRLPIAPDALHRDFKDMGMLQTMLDGTPRTEEEVAASIRRLIDSHPSWLSGLRSSQLQLEFVAITPATPVGCKHRCTRCPTLPSAPISCP